MGFQKMKDYYKILEVDPKDTIEKIKSQHRFLIHAWHPDKFPDGELKEKAEEKTKDINEAFRILGDSSNRENYDRTLHSKSSASPSTTQQTYSQPETNNSAQAQIRCESCSLPVETKYVEFYENVGMIFMRQHRVVKGNFCKPCIDYYFWNLTGKTMLVGWWGTISFVVTPFILLNNLLRFIFTLGMKKPPLQIAPSPSPFWVFSAISGFIIIGYFMFSLFSPAFSQSSYTPTPFPTPAVSAPTRVPIKVKTPTSSAPPCIRWDKVTISMEGQKVCVYGVVDNFYNTNETATRIKFTSEPNTFFLHAANKISKDFKQGECVAAVEVVQIYDNKIPYMSVSDSDLLACESRMNLIIPTVSLHRSVTWMELVSFIEADHTNWNNYDPDNYVCLDFAIDLVENAGKQNIKAWVVGVYFYDDDIGHAFTGFETTDRGMVFIEPQTDIPYINVTIGKLLCDAWTGTNCMGKIKSLEYFQCDHSHYCINYLP